MSRGGRVLIWVSDTRRRRWIYAAVALVLAILCVFPQPFTARAKLLPQDSSSAGLGQIVNSLGGQLSTFANLLTGGRPPNDLYLIIGRSSTVTEDVIAALKLAGPGRRFASVRDAKLALAGKVDVHLLLGGVVEIETRTTDPDESMRLTEAYQRAISDRIGALGRQTIRRKGQIVREQFQQASARVGETERALDAFRKANRLASPEAELGSAITSRANLQAQLQAKQVELRATQQYAGPENVQLANIRAQIATLQAQIAQTDRPSTGTAGTNLSGLSALSSRYFNLYRDYRFAQGLYDVYARASEQTAVESLVVESATYIQIVEPANLDAQRHFNVSFIALLAALIVLALFTELYVPATGLRWRDVLGRSDPDSHDRN